MKNMLNNMPGQIIGIIVLSIAGGALTRGGFNELYVFVEDASAHSLEGFLAAYAIFAGLLSHALVKKDSWIVWAVAILPVMLASVASGLWNLTIWIIGLSACGYIIAEVLHHMAKDSKK